MEKQSARQAKQDTTYKSSFEDEDFIIVRKSDFLQGISALLFNAWKHRNSESHLYALYNYIQSLQCLTLLHTARPSRVVTPWPQPLFGTLGPPQGVNNYPARNDTLPSNYYPDHARIMIFGSKEQGPSFSLEKPISVVLDSSEVKVLNVETEWHLPECLADAEKATRTHLVQVCDSSLAGLAHNPFWTSIYAFLFVGPYFSLFAWKTRPDAQHLQPLPVLPYVPKPGGRRTKKKREGLIAKRAEVIDQRAERINNTPLPDVIYYNEPVFNLTQSSHLKWYEKVSLSPKYLHALSLPSSALDGLACQPSWFGASDSNRFAENNRRVKVQQDMGREAFQNEVIEGRLQEDLATIDVVSDRPDPTLAGPKPPDSSDSQQSRFSEGEPQELDVDAGPHPMRTRASTQDVEELNLQALLFDQ